MLICWRMLQAKFQFEHLTQSMGCSVLSDSNQKRTSADLKQQIARCKEEADWLKMFRYMLWKGQLEQVAKCMFDIVAYVSH